MICSTQLAAVCIGFRGAPLERAGPQILAGNVPVDEPVSEKRVRLRGVEISDNVQHTVFRGPVTTTSATLLEPNTVKYSNYRARVCSSGG